MNLQWIETHMPPEWVWADFGPASQPLDHRRRALPPGPGMALVDVDGPMARMDSYREFVDAELKAAQLRHAMAVFVQSWESAYPALRPERSIRRRRRMRAR